MKKILFVAFALFISAAAAVAQRYAVIDTRYILDKMPEYAAAQKQLDAVAAGWQKEIDTKQSALDKMYKDYEAEQVMLRRRLRKNGKTSCS